MTTPNQKPFSESGTSPPSISEIRHERFNRLFPDRVEKLINALRIVGHCSKSHCERNQELTEKAFILIARQFEEVAKSFGVSFQITVKTEEVAS